MPFDTNHVPLIHTFLYIHKPVAVFSAPLVSMQEREGAFVGVNLGSPTLGSYGNIKPEMTLYISRNGNSFGGGSQRVRGVDPSNNRILVGRCGVGIEEGQLSGEIGETVTVYEDYRPFIKAPFITALPEVQQYKDEQLYPSDNAAQPPVANAGTDVLVVTDFVDFANISFNGVGSFAVRQGATITSYLWDLKDAEYISGSNTSVNPTVKFNRGVRWISLTVTDSNGISHTTHRLVAVLHRSDCTSAVLSSMTASPFETSMNFELEKVLLSADLPPRAKVLVAEHENYLPAPRQHVFSGWITQEQQTLDDPSIGRHLVDLKVENVTGFMKRNHLFSQSINAVDSEEVGGWFVMPDANIDRLMHHIVHWHSSILSSCGLTLSGLGGTYPFRALTTSGGTLLENVSRLCQAIGHELVVDLHNFMQVKGDPHVLPTPAQKAAYSLPTQRPTTWVYHISEDEYSSFQLSAENPPSSYWFKAMGQIATYDIENIAVVGCTAPSNAPNFGTSESSRNDFLVTSQEELNVWAANLYAATMGNSVAELNVTMVSGVTLHDLVIRGYVTIDLPADVVSRYNLQGNWTLEQVDYSYGDYGKSAIYTLRKERPALAPARTLPQVEDDSLDQSWNSFDEDIDFTTGDITQGYESMGLTKEELEDVISRMRLKAFLSDFATDENGNSDDSGGGGDPTDPETIYMTEAKKNGGYWEVSVKLSALFKDLADFYADVDTAPDGEALMTQYIKSRLPDAPSGMPEAWAEGIFDSSGSIPAPDTAARESMTQYMYCEDDILMGLNGYKVNVISSTEWIDWDLAFACITDTQFNRWYNLGAEYPLGTFTSYGCYRTPPVTLTLNLQQIHDEDVVISNAMTWSGMGTPPATIPRRVLLHVKGVYEDDNYIKDGLYVFDKATNTPTYTPLILAIRTTFSSNHTYTQLALLGAAPPYNPTTHEYIYSTRFNRPTLADMNTVRYSLQDTRSEDGTATIGAFEVIYTDLGNYS